MQMIIYPLKYMASNMTKYATANCSICNKARTICSMRVGRTRIDLDDAAGGHAAVDFCVPDASALSDEDEAAGFCAGARYWARICARWTIKASYSRAMRRRNSRTMTRQMTPMQEPANIPRDLMCQLLARKPVSSVSLFWLYSMGLYRMSENRTGIDSVPVP